MKFVHSMIRVHNLENTLDFFLNKLGFVETRRHEHEKGRFTLVFVATAKGEPEVELTYNWDEKKPYDGGRNFGHLAYVVDDIHSLCQKLLDNGVTISRPPRDGRMAFIRTPDNISIEFLQKGGSLTPIEPWVSMENTGEW
jgi:lactoylglutathione lyase